MALSDHTDFNGTLEHIAATGAKHVVTDNTRRGRAVELALAISRRLGIEARPSSNLESLEWGSVERNTTCDYVLETDD